MKNTIIMKKSIFAVLPVAAALLFSCNPEEPDTPPTPDPGTDTLQTQTPAIVITNAALGLTMAFEGGQTSIEYALQNPVDGGFVRAVASENCTWLNGFDTSEEGIVRFNVDENSDRSDRVGSLTLYYFYNEGEVVSSDEILVTQEANIYDYIFEVPYSAGYYYGDKFNTDGQQGMQYWLWLTEHPVVDDYAGAGNNFLFQIYADEPENMGSIAPPEGTYYLATTGKVGTLGGETSVVNTDDFTQAYFADGTLEIRKDDYEYICEADMTYPDGVRIKVIYKGFIILEDSYTEIPPEPEPVYSTLTGDITVELCDSAYCRTIYYGDLYKNGTSYFRLEFRGMEDENDGWGGDAFNIDLYCPASSNLETGLPSGRYEIVDYDDLANAQEFTARGGTIDGAFIYGTWYATRDWAGIYEPWAPLKSGYIDISEADADGNVTIDINACDDHDPAYKVTCIWSGELEYKDAYTPIGLPEKDTAIDRETGLMRFPIDKF